MESPSSGDCEVAAERCFGKEGQFGSEIAAPVFKMKDTIWHRSEPLQKECEWKPGESAVGQSGKDAQVWRLPLVGEKPCRVARLDNAFL